MFHFFLDNINVVYYLSIVKRIAQLDYKQKLKVKLEGQPIFKINIVVLGSSCGKTMNVNLSKIFRPKIIEFLDGTERISCFVFFVCC